MQCRRCKADIPDNSKFCLACGAKQTPPAPHRKTRGNGQGCAVKRGNTWTAVWTEGTFRVEGSRKIQQKRRWKGGFKTKTEALTYAANPPAKQVAPPTLRHYWEVYEKTGLKKVSSNKQCAYKIAWRRLSGIAEKKISDLGIGDLQELIDDQTETYYPAKDMKNLLSALYKLAMAEEQARVNLSQFLVLPPLDEKALQPFSEEEIKKLWAAYGAGEEFVGALLLMIYTGMMPGELFRLEKDMIHWDRQEIIGCGLKTGKRKETPIVFPDFIKPILRRMCEGSKSRIGRVVGVNKYSWYDEYHLVLSRVGVRDLPPYSCRHTTATALALGNIAPSVIQEVMRHAKFTTTQRYIHPDTASAHEAVNTLDSKIFPGST